MVGWEENAQSREFDHFQQTAKRGAIRGGAGVRTLKRPPNGKSLREAGERT